jgi:hypothetical protein
MIRPAVVSLLLLVLLGGCGVTDPAEQPTMNGAWRGQVGTSLVIRLELTESSGGKLTGTGATYASSSSLALLASGERKRSAVALTLQVMQTNAAMDFRGVFSGDTAVVGTIGGYGFRDETAVTFRRVE